MSIADASNWVAVFNEKLGDKEYENHHDLFVWCEVDGHVQGLIVDDRTGKLRSAESYSNFVGYAERRYTFPYTFQAPTGWWVEWLKDGAVEWAERVVGWLYDRQDYQLAAIVYPSDDGDGWSEPIKPERGKVRFSYEPERQSWP